MHVQIEHQNNHRTEISEGSCEIFLSGTQGAYEASTGQ